VLLTALLTGAVMAPGFVAAQSATPGGSPVAATSAPLSWTACAGTTGGWECADLAVPLDYADSGGPAIDLAVTRLPAGDPTRRIGSLFFNCGGPGCPTASFLHQAGMLLFPDEIRARFDLIGFDPRGIGASEPLDCQIDWGSYLALDPSPDDAVEREAWLAGGRDYAGACAANGGDLLPFMGTENVVSDMERLREALGEEAISFLGLSYGTSLGARYADRYPNRVRAFALDSGLPSFIDPVTFVPQWVDGIERSFDAFLADCADAMTCPFSSGGDPGAAFDTLMTSLDATPLAVEMDSGSRLVGQRAVLDAIDVTLSQPARWSQLASALAAAARGDGAPILALADQRNERLPDGTYHPGAETFLGVGCLDFPITRDQATFETLAAKAAGVAPRLGAYYATWVLPCAFWPVAPAPASHAPVAAGAPTILVVGATLDTQDPYQWSLDMAAQLEPGVLLRRDGTGHPSYLESACVEEAINAYLLELTLPPANLICDSAGGLRTRFG
jgi:pimeloyl-ACP methyl ester carboxylesterase